MRNGDVVLPGVYFFFLRYSRPNYLDTPRRNNNYHCTATIRYYKICAIKLLCRYKILESFLSLESRDFAGNIDSTYPRSDRNP